MTRAVTSFRSFASFFSIATVSLASVAMLGCGSTPDDETKGNPTYDPFALPANVYSHGDPSPKEQALLELMQRVRADPQGEIARVIDIAELQQAIAQFNVDKNKVISDFAKYAPVPPLAHDPRLHESALFHSNDMSTHEFQEHNGSAGEQFFERIDKTGYKYSFCEENIFAYARDVEDANGAFLIDWGNPDIGHRMAMLDLDGEKRDVGIAIVENTTSTKVGPLIVTEDFGMPFDSKRLLVGVAYRDMNGNGVYDEGEGVAGLKVVPNAGDTYAVTSTSGGYAIPMTPGAGAFKVQIQDDAGTAIDQQDTSLDKFNVKVDFIVR